VQNGVTHENPKVRKIIVVMKCNAYEEPTLRTNGKNRKPVLHGTKKTTQAVTYGKGNEQESGHIRRW
jgi:hypothetical protein